jgi:hypothetical protein
VLDDEVLTQILGFLCAQQCVIVLLFRINVIIIVTNYPTTTCFGLYRSCSGFILKRRFVFTVLLLYCGFYYSYSCAVDVFSRWHSSYLCSWLLLFGYFVEFLYLHSCVMLLGDVVLVLNCVACSMGVFQSLCFVFNFV